MRSTRLSLQHSRRIGATSTEDRGKDMANIFARKPGHYQVPARRYEQFISVFEKCVSEIQKQVTAMEKMERIYSVVREVMEAADLPNDMKFELGPNQLKIKVSAAATDKIGTFDALLKSIGLALRDAGLHEDGEGAIRRGGYWYDIDATWAIKRGSTVQVVAVNIDIPRQGLADVEILCEEATITMANNVYTYRQRPSRDSATEAA